MKPLVRFVRQHTLEKPSTISVKECLTLPASAQNERAELIVVSKTQIDFQNNDQQLGKIEPCQG